MEITGSLSYGANLTGSFPTPIPNSNATLVVGSQISGTIEGGPPGPPGPPGPAGSPGAQGPKGDPAVVNGKSGSSITLDKSDIGLGNADNTSDVNKPISSAQQIALDSKEPSITVLPVSKGGTNVGTLNGSRFLTSNGVGDAVQTNKTIPNGVVVGTTDVQTLTNKTVNNPAMTGSLTTQFNILSTATTLNATHHIVEITANVPITLPTAASIQGRQYVIINATAGNITVNTTSSQTIGNSSPTTTAVIATGNSLSVVSNNANWRIV